MSNKEIYIVLMHTGTLLSRIIQFISQEPYSHVSIAFDQDFKTSYSFGRKNMDRILPTGFIHEELRAVSKKYTDTKCAVYSLTVGTTQYNALRKTIDRFSTENWHSYNLLGTLGAWACIPISRKNRYFCSQFVAAILNACGVELFDKEPALVTPSDFRALSCLKMIFSGNLADLHASEIEIQFYLDQECI